MNAVANPNAFLPSTGAPVSRQQQMDYDSDRLRLAYEVARNQVGAKLPMHDLLTRLQVTPEMFLECSRSELFKRSVKDFVRELEDTGESFRIKARIAAEASIPVAYRIAHDENEPSASRLKAVNDMVRWADLEPKQNAMPVGGPGFVINFNLPNLGGPVTSTGTPLPTHNVTITQESD